MHARAFVALLLIALTLPSCLTHSLWTGRDWVNGGYRSERGPSRGTILEAEAFRQPGLLLLRLRPTDRLTLHDGLPGFPLDATYLALQPTEHDEWFEELLDRSANGERCEVAFSHDLPAGHAMFDVVECEYRALDTPAFDAGTPCGRVAIVSVSEGNRKTTLERIAWTPFTLALDIVLLPIGVVVILIAAASA